MSDKVRPIECVVGSQNWVYAVQESILDNQTPCFVCGSYITYKRDFYYMRGRMGTIMLHDDCFTPNGVKRQMTTVEKAPERPTGDWLTIFEAAKYTKIPYMTIYQRVASGTLTCEKRDGRWYIYKRSLDEWVPKAPPGRKPGTKNKTARVPRARMWRSEITEPVERISVSQAAKLVGASRGWVTQRKDQFDAVKIDGAWQLSKKLVEDFVAEEERGYAQSLRQAG